MNAQKAQTEETPKVGMGATEYGYTDRHPYTVIRVSDSGKTFWMQEDKAIRTDDNGMSETQNYLYEPDPNGEIVKVLKVKDGWKVAGKSGMVSLGVRRKYHDFSF